MSKIISASHVSRENIGADAAEPIQVPAQPRFDINYSASERIVVLKHANCGVGADAFRLSDEMQRNIITAYTKDSLIQFRVTESLVQNMHNLLNVLERDSTKSTITSCTCFSEHPEHLADGAGYPLPTQVGGFTQATTSLSEQSEGSAFKDEYSSCIQVLPRDTVGDSDTVYQTDPVGLDSVKLGNLTRQACLWLSNITKRTSVTAKNQLSLLKTAADGGILSIRGIGPSDQMKNGDNKGCGSHDK